MKSLIYFFLLLFVGTVSAQECAHSHGRTQNTLVPDVKLTTIPRNVTESSAVAFLTEVGRRNFRLNGTYGWLLDASKRFKVSGEYLQQKFDYRYSTGTARRWMRQYALGATYEQEFCHPYLTNAKISGFFSYAPSLHLENRVCNNFIISRRIAGSTAYGFEVGSRMNFWSCAFFTLDANYDAVIYHRKYHSNRHVEGFGGCVGFHQQFFETIGMDLRAEFRRPFNFYRALLNWSPPSWSGLTLGVFGSHTRGKSGLVSNTLAGIEIAYSFGNDFCQERMCCEESCCSPDLDCWVRTPAVYMPEVLAIAEERAVKICYAPTSSPIPAFTTSIVGPFSYAVGSFFSNPPESTPLIFSATGLPSFASIDPATGVISGFHSSGSGVFNVVVAASNSCGSTNQPLTMTFDCPAPTSSSIPPFTTNSLGPFSYVVGSFFTNPPGSSPLVFSATGLPSFASIDPVTGTLFGINPGADDGFDVVISASNSCGSTSQPLTMSFGCPSPTSSPITPFTVSSTGPFAYAVGSFFTNPPGSSPLVFSATGLPPFATIDSSTGTISGIHSSEIGVFNVVVTASNSCGSTSQPLTMTFTCPLPSSTPIPPFSTCASGPFSYAVGGFFINPPGSSSLVFSATGLPSFATIDTSTGVISGTHAGEVGVFNAVVTASNSCGSTSQPLTMTFTCPAPTSSPIPNRNLAILAGNPYQLDVVSGNFASPCGQAFTFTATGLPTGSTINPTTGLISGIVTPFLGPYNVTIFGTTLCGVTSQSFQLSFFSARS